MSTLKVNTLQNTSGNTLTFIKQVVSTTKTDTASLSIANGVINSSIVSGLSVSITPSSTSSKILILAQVACSVASNGVFVYLVRGSTLICQADADGSRARASSMTMQAQEHYTDTSVLNFLDSPSTTSQITYGIKLGHSSGSTRTVYVNRPDNNTNSNNYARTTSTITVMEVAG